jgi:triacylglycerol lipase
MSILVELPLALYDEKAFHAFHPVAELDLGAARAMAWMSQLAYETDHPDKVAAVCDLWELGTPRVIASPAGVGLPLVRTRGIVVEGRGATIVAFAGTDPLVPANWITDFTLDVTPENVHGGFDRAARAVFDELRAALTSRHAQPVIFTGHSMGAALTVLTAERVLDELGIRPTAVYGFGMPRAGDKDFALRYNGALGAATYRFVHGSDIVCAVPPSRLGFCHVGKLIRCAQGGPFTAVATPATGFDDDPQFAPVLAGGLRQGLIDLLALRTQPSFRDDLLGRLSGLLAPPIADHLPDRYCNAVLAWSCVRTENRFPLFLDAFQGA